MESDLKYGLERWLAVGRIPKTITKEIGEEVRKIAPGYQLDKNTKLLTKINTQGQNREPRIVIGEHQIKKVLRETHNHPLSGHQGQDATYLKTSEVYYWPNMKKDIIEFVKTCKTCQKRSLRKGEAPLEPIKKFAHPFHQVGIDIMGPLPMTLTRKRYVVVAIDHFTKWIEARALETADAQNVASFIYDDIICRHGVPNILTSDNGTEFVNELITTLTNVYKIRHIKSTVYHPQGNGQTERANQTLKNLLAKLILEYKGDWSHYLSSALFITRTSRQASTRFTPADLLHGYQFRQAFDHREPKTKEPTPEAYMDQEMSRLQEIRAQAAGFIKKAQNRQKKEHDSREHKMEPLKIGDQVLLYRNTVESNWSSKLEPKWDGPFFVQSIKGLTYRLRKQHGTILSSSYHRNRLRLYNARSLPDFRPVVSIATRTRSQPAEMGNR